MGTMEALAPARVERIHVQDGTSFIDVRGGGFDSALFVEGKPIALNWCDCEGSVGQLLIRGGVYNHQDHVRALRRVLLGGLDPELPLAVQLSPLLQLFSPAEYEIKLWEDCPDCELFQVGATERLREELTGYYPFGFSLVATQAMEMLRISRIHRYAGIIATTPHRPIAITTTVEGGWCEFVLDGHHKLMAYQMAGLPPTFISICRIAGPAIEASIVDAVNPNHPKASHYRSVKAKYDQP
jgi:hypothetical protein